MTGTGGAPDPWGAGEPPALPAGAAPAELPDLTPLTATGWHRLCSDPMLSLLPAVWPPHLRCWVPALPDRSRYDDLVEIAAEAGYPLPPEGRAWLVRSPWPWLGLDLVILLIRHRAAELLVGSDSWLGPAEMASAASDLLAWPDDRLRSWWSGPEADAATAWSSLGRTGDEVAALVLCGLGPDQLHRLLGLSEEQAVRWCHAVGYEGPTTVDRIVLWRSLGLPSDPPANLYQLSEVPDEQIVRWWEAGFDADWMIDCLEVPLGTARAWRDRGHSSAAVRDLLHADPTLTPAEADDFTGIGITGPDLLRWVDFGFSAAEARDYRNADVRPGEARVWRSLGFTALDVQPGQHLPPDYVVGGWAMFAGGSFRDIEHTVTDPDGTRGRQANREPLPRGMEFLG